jgi:hypothetical protein
MGRFKHNDIAGADDGEQALGSHPLRGCQFVPIFTGNTALPNRPGRLPFD